MTKIPGLWPHQEEAIQKGLQYGHVAVFTPPGSGKSRVALELIRRWGLKAFPVLVLAKDIYAGVWPAQAARWLPGVHVRVLTKDHPKRRTSLMATRGIAVVNYEAVYTLRQILGARKWGTVIADESHFIASPAARVTQTVQARLGHIPHRIIAAAWPAPKRLENVFSMFRLVDQGEALSTRMSDFRANYFFPDPMGYGWQPQDGAERRIAAKIGPKSAVLKDKDYKALLGIPPVMEQIVHVDLDDECLRAYCEAKDEWSLNGEDIPGAHVRFLRMIQATSGVVGESFHENAKTAALVEILRSIPDDENVVIFAWYRAEVSGVARQATAARRAVWTLMGGQDYRAILPAWASTKGGVVVVQSECGLGWQEGVVARHCIFHSRPHSAYIRHQNIGRLARPGQTRPVLVTDLIARGTLDALQHKALLAEIEWIDLVRDLVAARSDFSLDVAEEAV